MPALFGSEVCIISPGATQTFSIPVLNVKVSFSTCSVYSNHLPTLWAWAWDVQPTAITSVVNIPHLATAVGSSTYSIFCLHWSFGSFQVTWTTVCLVLKELPE
jgi:hypothetical protein